MNAVIDIGYAVVFAAAAVVLYRLCRTPRPTAAWDMAAEEWVHLPPGVQPGPGQLMGREIAEADPLELLYLSPAYDPELDAGFDRLRAALRDEQKGEQE